MFIQDNGDLIKKTETVLSYKNSGDIYVGKWKNNLRNGDIEGEWLNNKTKISKRKKPSNSNTKTKKRKTTNK